MAEMRMTAVGLKNFTFHKDKLVAECSQFGPLKEGHWWLCRMYDDACDIGIAIHSHITDKIEKFVLSEVEKSEDDLVAWHFTPINRDCRVKEVIIFND